MHAETDIEAKIIADPYFCNAIRIGKVRGGHPEGILRIHIEHILAAIDKLPADADRTVLRMGAYLHDIGKFAEYHKPHLHPEGITTFEHAALQRSSNDFSRTFSYDQAERDRNVPSHALYSYKFAKQFTDDEVLLNLVRYHDTGMRLKKNHENDKSTFKFYFGKNPELFLRFAYVDSVDREKDVSLWLQSQLRRNGLLDHDVI